MPMVLVLAHIVYIIYTIYMVRSTALHRDESQCEIRFVYVVGRLDKVSWRIRSFQVYNHVYTLTHSGLKMKEYCKKFQKDLNNNSPKPGYRLQSKSKAM